MVTLRDYQHEAIDRIVAGFDRRLSVLAVMATGLGKTTLFAELIRRMGDRRWLVIAHRDELIRQAAERIELLTGEPAGVEMGERSVHEGYSLAPPRVVVSSVQTLSRPRRLTQFRVDAFGGLVVDEAHHATSASYKVILDHFAAADVLGVTATPVRGDGARLGRVFQHVACDLGIRWAVEHGWLCPVDQKVVRVDGLDFSRVRTTAGDWSAADLDAELTREEPLHKVAVPTLELSAGGPTLVFCAGVGQAEALSAVLSRYRPGCSRWLCGETDAEERRDMIADYKAGRVQILVNVGVLTEGFDAPATSHIVMARPTKSLGLYTQILGRGTRALPGVVDGPADAAGRVAAIAASAKPVCTVLDFAGSTGKLDPSQVTAADIFGDGQSDEVKERAKRMLSERPGGGSVQQVLERAAEFVAAERALAIEEDARLRRLKADRVDYRVEDAGTIGVGDQRLPQMHEPATRGQRGYLYRLGVPWADTERITKRQASGWIGRLLKQQSGGEGVAG